MQLHFPKLIELLKDDLVVGGVNPYTCITDANLTKLSMSIHLDRAGIDKDGTAIRCELNGVDKHIVKSLFQELRICQQRRSRANARVQIQLDLAFLQIFHIILAYQ